MMMSTPPAMCALRYQYCLLPARHQLNQFELGYTRSDSRLKARRQTTWIPTNKIGKSVCLSSGQFIFVSCDRTKGGICSLFYAAAFGAQEHPARPLQRCAIVQESSKPASKPSLMKSEVSTEVAKSTEESSSTEACLARATPKPARVSDAVSSTSC